MPFLAFLGLLIVDVLFVIFGGWILTYLWGWFIVPVFGLPSLTIVSAVGLAIVVSFLAMKTPEARDDDEELIEVVVRKSFMKFFYMIFIFGLGFLFSLFM